MLNSPNLDSHATMRVNLMRALASGLVWGAIFAGFYLFLALVSWTTESAAKGLTMLLSIPLAALAGLIMPVSFMIITLFIDTLTRQLSKVPILGFLVNLLMPNMALVTALVMIFGDPLVYLIRRIAPSLVPIDKYGFIMFYAFIAVEKVPTGNLPNRESENKPVPPNPTKDNP